MDELSLITLAAAKSYTDEHGGGGGGTTNYNDLSNQPQIEGHTLIGNKSASDLGLATEDTVEGILDGQTIDSFGDVETALANKQNTLTAGNYISIANDGTINVTQGIGVYDVYSYKFEGRVQSTNYWTDIIKSKNGVQQSSTRYSNTQAATPINIDDRFTLKYGLGTDSKWHVTLLVDSNEHQAGEEITWRYNETKDFTETFNVSQDSSTDLATKGDVNTAIAGKQDTLTFDDTPTDNSNNPVKSNGIYDALALKQNATDNSLETTAKTIVGAINEHEGDIGSLMSGLTNYQAQNDLNLEAPNRKNVLPITLSLLKSSNIEGTWNGNEYTYRGITYTCAFDADGYLTSVTGNGTATDTSALRFYRRTINPIHLDGSFIVSGGYNEHAAVVFGRTYNSSWQELGKSTGGDSAIFTCLSSDDQGSSIDVDSGTELDNAVFYPMVRSSYVTNSTFAPYIPSVETRLDAVESGVTNLNGLIVYVSDSESFGNVAVGETKRTRLTLPAKTGYNLASANGHLNYADSAIVSCQITDNTTLDVYVTNTKSFVLENQTLYYRLIYVKTNA